MARKEIEELQRIRETHMKQLQVLNNTKTELEEHLSATQTANNTLMNG